MEPHLRIIVPAFIFGSSPARIRALVISPHRRLLPLLLLLLMLIPSRNPPQRRIPLGIHPMHEIVTEEPHRVGEYGGGGGRGGDLHRILMR